MNFLKKMTGLLVFVAAIAGAVAVSRYFSGPRPVAEVEAPPPPPPAPPPISAASGPRPDPQLMPGSPAASVAMPPVRFRARLVTLDFTTGKSHLTLELARDRTRPAPERVWAWASFHSPEGGGRCEANAVEVREPFARGDRPTVVVELDASRCGRPRSPAATFYARVNVSPQSAEAARLDPSQLDPDLSKATPVVIAGAKKTEN